MKPKQVDAYTYTGKDWSSKDRSLTLRKGDIFYYVTREELGDYISLDSQGPYIKLSNSEFNQVSRHAELYRMSVDSQKLIKTTDGSQRSFTHPVEYQALLSQRANARFILDFLQSIMEQVAPRGTEIKRVNTLKGSPNGEGQLGVVATVSSVRYKLVFMVSANPFFGYSIWVQSRPGVDKRDLPAWSKRLQVKIPKVYHDLCVELDLTVNTMKETKSIVALPSKKFNGTIYQWSAKI